MLFIAYDSINSKKAHSMCSSKLSSSMGQELRKGPQATKLPRLRGRQESWINKSFSEASAVLDHTSYLVPGI